MDAVETAIRNALERGDAHDPAYREKVYDSAFAALERSIEARPDLSADAAERRRDHLKGKIRNIETEFAPAEAPPEPERPPEAPPPPPPPQEPTAHEPEPAPPIAPEPPEPEPRNEPRMPAFSPLRQAAPAPQEPPRREPSFTPPPPNPSVPPAEGEDLGPLLTEEDLILDDEFVAAEPPASAGPELGPVSERRDYPPAGGRRGYGRRRRRRWTLPLLIGLIALLAIIAVVWWLLSGSDMLGVSNLDQKPVATTPASASAQGQATTDDENWIIVFTPSDPTRAIANDGAKAEVVTHAGDSFLRISSPGADQPVSFQVGQGILEKLAGHEAVFDIIARAEDGQKTQIAVSCDLGSLGDCGRSRFEVGGTISDFLVRTPLKDGPPSSGGTISIVPDVTGSGKALEILRIRASVAGES